MSKHSIGRKGNQVEKVNYKLDHHDFSGDFPFVN